MVINSIEFLIFVLSIIIIYKIVPNKLKWVVLLIASYIFYFLNSTYMTIFIIITTISIYFVALKMSNIDKQTKIKLKNLEDKEQKKRSKEIS